MRLRPANQSSKQLGRPLGTSRRDWRRRLLLHHVPLALASAVLFALFMALSLSGDRSSLDMTSRGVFPQEAAPRDHSGGQTSHGTAGSEHDGGAFLSRADTARATTATGYVATGLLGLTLLIGPANLLLRKRNPVSSYLRRDVGAWTALVSIVHVILGLQVHVNPSDTFNFLRYFVFADGTPKTNSFGLGNWTGLAATVIVVGLLAISTDRSLQELKPKRWKRFQRLNYALFALVVLHAFFYGALLRMTAPFTLVLIGIVTAVLVGQLVGIWLWRQRHAPPAAAIQREQQPAGAPR